MTPTRYTCQREPSAAAIDAAYAVSERREGETRTESLVRVLRAAYAVDGLGGQTEENTRLEQVDPTNPRDIEQEWRVVAVPTAGLIEFFWRCWDSARGLGVPEGEDVQDWGEELGLLVKVVAPAPCGPGCVCEEYVGPDDFPTDCYRPTVDRPPRPLHDTAP